MMSYKHAYMQIYPAMGFLTNQTLSFEKLVLILLIIMALFIQTKLQTCTHILNPKIMYETNFHLFKVRKY